MLNENFKLTKILGILYRANKLGIWIWVQDKTLKYKAPENIDISKILLELKQYKQEIINILEYNAVFNSNPVKDIIYKTYNTQYSLSFGQSALWFIEQYEQGTNAYHVPEIYELEKDTDKEGVKYAIQQIVSRHEILRSTIEQNDEGHAIQIVHEEPLFIEELVVKDDFDLIIKEEINRPFNLNKEYPIRVKFFTIESSIKDGLNKTLLLINTHHIASDGWSSNIFQKELILYYEAFIDNNPTFTFPALEIQYKDYALWQKSYLTGGVLENQLNYWRNKLLDYQILEFPTDYVRPIEIDYKGACEEFEINKTISQKVRELAKNCEATLNSVMLSSINILLSKYTGKTDIIVGSVIANRRHRQTEDLIGFFVNTQVNRTILGQSQNFKELIHQVHQDQIEAQLHQDLPFEKLVDELNVDREKSRHPLFQIMFTVQNSEKLNEKTEHKTNFLNPLRVEDIHEVEKFDLSIVIDDTQEELIGQINYATSLFKKDTIMKLIQHYINLLDLLLESPDKPYSKISLLSKEENEQIVYNWNNTDKKYINCNTVIDLFEEQVLKSPNNIAVVYKEQKLNYKELNEKSNQLARHIRSLYIQKTGGDLTGVLISLYLERNIEMVIGILAVLKAGGAYVPLDPNYPQDRIDYIIDDTKPEFILSQKYIRENSHNKLPQEKIIDIDLTDPLYDNVDFENLNLTYGPSELAYVIYTSGTTGKPKGVMIEHRNLVNLLFTQKNIFEIDSNLKVLQYASMVFDASVWEIFSAISFGAQLFIMPSDIRNDTALISDYIDTHQINMVTLPPAILNVLPEREFSSLKLLIVAGESCPSEIFDRWNRGLKLMNAYGPTEATVCATIHHYCKGDLNTNIGKPITNTQVYVLSPDQNPVPVGVVGELYIGGAGIARGYLNQPELTKERFVENPFVTSITKEKGYTRLYKTGDLVRWLADGNIEYIGRTDDQVKIRGYRIELGEIENVLMQVDGIKQVCVLAKQKKSEVGSNKYIVGYYVLENISEVISENTILKKLSDLLPEYMIPSTLVAMESFPITINGKIDKRALPDPEFGLLNPEYVLATSELEKTICKIWQDVLGFEKIGVTDNFFRIGGDSILSIQVSSRIRQAGYICQVKDIFEYKTIEKLAEYLYKKGEEINVNTEQGILTGELGLLPIQQWFVSQVEKGEIREPNHWNQSFLIKVPELDIDKMQYCIKELVSYHDVLRIRYTKNKDEDSGKVKWRQIYQSKIEQPAFNVLNVSNYSIIEIEEILTNWQSNFNLEQGPLFQVGYLHGYEDGSAKIYFAIHHMVVDGVSWRIIAEDFKVLYDGNKLPPKSSSYRQWISTIKNYADQNPLELFYWEDKLKGMPNYWYHEKLNEFSTGFVELNKEHTKSLLQEISLAYHTDINDLLLTALAYALKDINDNDIQGITLEGHGREEIDPSIDHSRTIGWFTTMFPVRLELKSSIKESIQCIKEGLRSIPNKGIGFGAFATLKESKFTYESLIPISFNYLGQFETHQSNWQVTSGESGYDIHPENSDHNAININGMVGNAKLGFTIVTKLGEDITLKLSDSFKRHLIKIIEHCKDKIKKEGSSYTPSDFKSVKLNQSLLEKLESNAREHHNEVAYIYSATSLQQGFIYHALSQPEDDAYRVQELLDYHESLDINLYLKAWENCITQYPILRTAFNWEDEIIQVIYKKGILKYELHDISFMYSQDDRDNAIENIRINDRKQGFDFTQPSLFRLHIIKQTNNYFTLIKSEHHCISDGWSGAILLSKLHYYYKELLNKKEVIIKEELTYLQTQEYIYNNKHITQKYWKDTLTEVDNFNDINPLLSYPIDVNSYKKVGNPDIVGFEITGNIYSEFKSFVLREGVTTNAVVQFIWHKLLHVYSNSLKSIVGVIVSGRDLPIEGIEDSVGLYINTLPLIINWDNDNTILLQLHEIQKKITEMNTHSFSDLAKLQKDGERLFNSLLVYFNYPDTKEENDIKISLRDSIEKGDYPLSLAANENGNSLNITLTYDSDYLTKDKAQKHLNTLNVIFHQVITSSGMSHKELSLLDSQEYWQVVNGWNSNNLEYSHDKTIVQLFEEQVLKSPDRIALVYNGQEISYNELNERSNQLARYIRSRFEKQTNKTLGPDTLIVLCLDRSLEMVIGILGVLKSGGAYVPIDPSIPQERIDYILEDTDTNLILCQRNICSDFSIQLPFEKVIYIDLAEEIYIQESKENLKQFSESKDLAYIIYTSGTTGRPKGVMQMHSNVMRLFTSTDSQFCFTDNDIWTLYHSYAFDFSVWELWGALIYGGKLIIVSKEQVKDIKEFYQICDEYKVTILNQTPSAFYRFADIAIASKESDLSLRCIIFGGEELNVNQLSNWWSYHEKNQLKTRLINMYGITETTVHVTYKEIIKNEIVKSSIGKPIGDLKAYILSQNQQPVPIGVIGELYIGGAGLARGYLNRPELTEERFVANIFATDSDREKAYTRLYKTGDLARWLDNGDLEYIGRNDDQVKIRGYRIELGEIENVFINIKGIKQACVITKEKKTEIGSNKYLVGYYVLEDNFNLDQKTIFAKLREVLPNYMVPSAIISMSVFPLTINGKLDKRSLPDPDFNSSDIDYVAPSSLLEKKICEIWQEVLGLERVGITDNFFRIGGDSILSIRLVSKIQSLGFDIGVRDIFNNKTIQNILLSLTKADPKSKIEYRPFMLMTNESTNSILKKYNLQIENLQDIYPASYLQSGMIIESLVKEKSHVYRDFISFTIDAEFDAKRFREIWFQLINKHENLRSTLVLQENGYVNVIHKKIDVNSKIRLLDNTYSIEQIVMTEQDTDFDFTSPGIFRLFVIKNNEEKRFTTVFSLHHAITDGWSVASITSEFFEAYMYDKPIEIDIQPSYGKFIGLELQAIVNENYKRFWVDYLSDYEVKSNNFLTNNEIVPSDNQILINEELGLELSSKILNLAKEINISPDIIFLGVYNLVLSEYYNTTDLVIGTTVNNRLEEEGGDRVFGLHLNMIPMRFQTKNNRSKVLKDYLLEILNNKLTLNEYKLYPFGKIKSDLNIQENIYQCSFNYVHFHVEEENISNESLIDEYSVARTSIPLILNISRTQNEFNLVLDGYGDFIEEEIAKKIVASIILCLSQITTNSNRLVNDYQLINSEDYEKIIYKWNSPYNLLSNEKTIIHVFQEQVRKTPNNVALVFEDYSVSYIELNEKSNQLARYIRSNYNERIGRPLEPDTPIVLFLEKGLEMIIGILAVLKSGGAYVPIEYNCPQERLEFIYKDTGSEIILSQKHIIADVKNKFLESKVIFIDLDEDLYNIENVTNLPNYNKPSDLAYIIYTSGTTGTPKGVMIEHRNVLSLIFNDYIDDITTKDVFAFLSSPVFDAATFEIFSPLLNGCKLLIEKDFNNLFSNVEKFKIFLTANKVSILWLTKTLFDNLYYLDNSLFEYLNYLIVGGEALDKNIVNRMIISPFKPKHFMNGYGPTESTTFTCTYNMTSKIDTQNVPIGKPINNRKCYVLSLNYHPVPIGVVGELYIAGAGIARGYLNRSDLTETCFMENMFATDEDRVNGYARLYKTGDLVRWLDDGNLEYVGRNDDQVKIRGYRIELGEIESALNQIEGIKQACVLVKENKTEMGNNKYLIGYYVLNKGVKLDEAIILDKLRGVLHDYMLPSALILLEYFPLTINGKLDRNALPDPGLGSYDLDYVAPTNELEKKICEIWKDVLGLEQVSIVDDFFRIGGNSILAIQLCYRINKSFGCNLKIADFFRLKTIHKLYDKIKIRDDKKFELLKPFYSKYNNKIPDLILIHGGYSGSEVYQKLCDNIGDKYNCIGIDNYNIYNERKIGDLNEIACYYLEEFEKKYSLADPINLLGWSLGGLISLEISKILENRGYKNINVVLLDTFIRDEFINLAIKKENEVSIQRIYEKELEEVENFMVDYKRNVFSATDSEDKIASTRIDYNLIHTKITLFKATQIERTTNETLVENSELDKYLKKLKMNNIDIVSNNIKVINLKCNHYNILDTNTKRICNFLNSMNLINKN
jgi:amino acid adenylation domain-containing protein/non-ribosomal peptide synthase protein (TIGR01720 family)